MNMISCRLQYLVLAGVLISAIMPAAASAEGNDVQSPQAEHHAGFSSAAGSIVASRDGFELRSLDDSFSYGGQADYTLRVLPDGDGIKVMVQVFASDMRASLVELGYDSSYWQLTDGQRGRWPGDVQPLQLSVPESEGSLHNGSVLPRPQSAAGVTGTFELLEARFVPLAGGHSAGRVSPQVANRGLSASIGDYNADGQVNLADMLRVGEYYGQQASDFPEGTLSGVDGDGNGVIDQRDIELIGNNLLMVSGNAPAVSIATSTLGNPPAQLNNKWPTNQRDLDWLQNYYLTLPGLDSPHSVYDDATQQEYAERVFQYTNEARADKKHTPLQRVPWLDAVAQAQAKHMAANGYFEHDSPQGMTIFDRIEAPDGPEWWSAGENIAAGYTTPEQAHKSWMDSGGHRKNIRNENYRYMGVGVYYMPGTEYGWYWVQVFATYHEDPLTHDWIDPGQGAPLITREQIMQMQGQPVSGRSSTQTVTGDRPRQPVKQPAKRRS